MQKVQHEAEPSPPPPCYHASKLSSGCWVLSIVALSSISHLLKSCKHHRVHSTSSQPENIPCWALQTRNYCCYFSLFFPRVNLSLYFKTFSSGPFTFPHQISVWTAVCKITSWCSCCQISVSFIILSPRKKEFIGKSATNTFPTESVCAIGTFCRDKNKGMQNT